VCSPYRAFALVLLNSLRFYFFSDEYTLIKVVTPVAETDVTGFLLFQYTDTYIDFWLLHAVHLLTGIVSSQKLFLFCYQITVVCFQMMPGSDDSACNVSDDSTNYWMGATVPPVVHPGDKFVLVFKNFHRVFTCPGGATAGQEIKIQASDGAAALMTADDIYDEYDGSGHSTTMAFASDTVPESVVPETAPVVPEMVPPSVPDEIIPDMVPLSVPEAVAPSHPEAVAQQIVAPPSVPDEIIPNTVPPSVPEAVAPSHTEAVAQQIVASPSVTNEIIPNMVPPSVPDDDAFDALIFDMLTPPPSLQNNRK
jgi:hypothetical protein